MLKTILKKNNLVNILGDDFVGESSCSIVVSLPVSSWAKLLCSTFYKL